ncbi:MAG: hypothetical protein HY695_09895 [Deltaproteobacteria bacterium]|nr:hypothetical protein [Deltaproteobacteria bacterium]
MDAREYLNQWAGPYPVMLGGSGLVLLVGTLDYWTGKEISLAMFYLFPVSLVAWFMKRLDGFCISLLTAMVWFAVDFMMGHFYSQPPFLYWNTAARLVFFAAVITILSGIKVAYNENSQIIDGIRLALAKINTLRAQTPICAWCQKVRDAEGCWRSLDAYAKEHSVLELTHGVCPECLGRLEKDVV